MTNLVDLAFQLNTHKTESGIGFYAETSEDGEMLTVSCDVDPEATIFVVQSDEQLLSVSQLFSREDVIADQQAKLNETLLSLSPVIPLSSVGLQGDDYILFGAMSTGTSFENIAHELMVQADNVSDVLDSLSGYLNLSVDETEEV